MVYLYSRMTLDLVAYCRSHVQYSVWQVYVSGSGLTLGNPAIPLIDSVLGDVVVAAARTLVQGNRLIAAIDQVIGLHRYAVRGIQADGILRRDNSIPGG